jgi:hypothetical protein
MPQLYIKSHVRLKEFSVGVPYSHADLKINSRHRLSIEAAAWVIPSGCLRFGPHGGIETVSCSEPL